MMFLCRKLYVVVSVRMTFSQQNWRLILDNDGHDSDGTLCHGLRLCSMNFDFDSIDFDSWFAMPLICVGLIPLANDSNISRSIHVNEFVVSPCGTGHVFPEGLDIGL